MFGGANKDFADTGRGKFRLVHSFTLILHILILQQQNYFKQFQQQKAASSITIAPPPWTRYYSFVVLPTIIYSFDSLGQESHHENEMFFVLVRGWAQSLHFLVHCIRPLQSPFPTVCLSTCVILDQRSTFSFVVILEQASLSCYRLVLNGKLIQRDKLLDLS